MSRGLGEVTIKNGLSVQVTNTPTVTMGAVSITGTPTVTMTAMTGTVTIAGTPTVTTGGITVVSTPAVTGAVGWIDTTGTAQKYKIVDGKPRISSTPYYVDIAEGNVAGHQPWSKTGFNDAVGTSQETMWSYSTEYSWITAAGQIEVLSSSDVDTNVTGAGAWTVRIGYLKSDYSEGSVTLNLAGTTPVASGASHADIWRINSFRVMSTGANLIPTGNITCRQVTGAKVVSYIRAGKTRARACFYTVPLGKTLYINSINYSCVGTKYMVMTNHANYENFTGTILQRGLFLPYTELLLLNSSFIMELNQPTRLPATVDLKVSVSAEASGSVAACQLKGWLE